MTYKSTIFNILIIYFSEGSVIANIDTLFGSQSKNIHEEVNFILFPKTVIWMMKTHETNQDPTQN